MGRISKLDKSGLLSLDGLVRSCWSAQRLKALNPSGPTCFFWTEGSSEIFFIVENGFTLGPEWSVHGCETHRNEWMRDTESVYIEDASSGPCLALQNPRTSFHKASLACSNNVSYSAVHILQKHCKSNQHQAHSKKGCSRYTGPKHDGFKTKTLKGIYVPNDFALWNFPQNHAEQQSCRAVAGTNDMAKAGHRCMLQSETPALRGLRWHWNPASKSANENRCGWIDKNSNISLSG